MKDNVLIAYSGVQGSNKNTEYISCLIENDTAQSSFANILDIGVDRIFLWTHIVRA